MIAIVLVSHSIKLAEGVIELAAQMAPDVTILSASGTPDGRLGTSLERVQATVDQALATADGVVMIADLGSAVLTTETALDLTDAWSGRVRLAHSPFVEGTVSAAVAAQQGKSLKKVRKAAEAAARLSAEAFWASQDEDDDESGEENPAKETVIRPERNEVSARVTLHDPLGLHARPAALVARKAASLHVPITIDGVDASSVMQLIALGAAGGQTVTVRAQGDGARDAVDAIVALIERISAAE